jgi:hypothetical protein
MIKYGLNKDSIIVACKEVLKRKKWE